MPSSAGLLEHRLFSALPSRAAVPLRAGKSCPFEVLAQQEAKWPYKLQGQLNLQRSGGVGVGGREGSGIQGTKGGLCVQRREEKREPAS